MCLGTNAVKHGALGPRDGELNIDWSTGETIELQWTETLKKQAEVHVGKGFGTDILKRVVPNPKWFGLSCHCYAGSRMCRNLKRAG